MQLHRWVFRKVMAAFFLEPIALWLGSSTGDVGPQFGPPAVVWTLFQLLSFDQAGTSLLDQAGT